MIFKSKNKEKRCNRLEDNFDFSHHPLKQPHDPIPFMAYTVLGVAILFKTSQLVYNNIPEIANLTDNITNQFYQTIEWFAS